MTMSNILAYQCFMLKGPLWLSSLHGITLFFYLPFLGYFIIVQVGGSQSKKQACWIGSSSLFNASTIIYFFFVYSLNIYLNHCIIAYFLFLFISSFNNKKEKLKRT